MKLSFELSDRDLRFFKREMAAVRQRMANASEPVIMDAASRVVERVRDQEVPDFVRERIVKLARLVDMLADQEWRLASSDRDRVVRALAYFAEPDDLIPDSIPGLGYMDDAIMVELVVRELHHEIEAYNDFCHFRSRKDKLLGKEAGATDREQWLGARRRELQSRMRRRRRSARASRGTPTVGKSPFSLW